MRASQSISFSTLISQHFDICSLNWFFLTLYSSLRKECRCTFLCLSSCCSFFDLFFSPFFPPERFLCTLPSDPSSRKSSLMPLTWVGWPSSVFSIHRLLISCLSLITLGESMWFGCSHFVEGLHWNLEAAFPFSGMYVLKFKTCHFWLGRMGKIVSRLLIGQCLVYVRVCSLQV